MPCRFFYSDWDTQGGCIRHLIEKCFWPILWYCQTTNWNPSWVPTKRWKKKTQCLTSLWKIEMLHYLLVGEGKWELLYGENVTQLLSLHQWNWTELPRMSGTSIFRGWSCFQSDFWFQPNAYSHILWKMQGHKMLTVIAINLRNTIIMKMMI